MAIVIRSEDTGMATFDTHDFGLAAALLTMGHELITMHPLENSKRMVFHFMTTSAIEHDAQDYWNGKLTVDAKRYWQESKNLKTRLYGARTS